jgi:hypothetical protein
MIGLVGGVLATWQANRTHQSLLPTATLINIFVLDADNDEILIAAWDGYAACCNCSNFVDPKVSRHLRCEQ